MIILHCRPPRGTATEVSIGRGLLASLADRAGARQGFLFFDPAAPRITIPASWSSLPHRDGESGKTLAHCEELLRNMSAARLDRGGLLVAVGGGVVGDLGGLAASLYLRGIELWQVPTTLLSMVDSAVGGKTAVNLPEGKNLVGTVHPATQVVVDIDTLHTLPEEQFQSGLAEVVKVAIGLDATLFDLLEENVALLQRRDPELLTEVVHRSIAVKISVVESDPFEHGRRRLLNLGHTLGHALEAHAGFRLPHGLCVARGLHFALAAAVAQGAMQNVDADRATRLLQACGFARDALPKVAELRAFLARDKKVSGSQVQFAIPTGIGSSRVQPLELDEIERLLAREPKS